MLGAALLSRLAIAGDRARRAARPLVKEASGSSLEAVRLGPDLICWEGDSRLRGISPWPFYGMHLCSFRVAASNTEEVWVGRMNEPAL